MSHEQYTHVSEKTVKKIAKKMQELARLLDEHDLIIFGGGCKDYGVLCDRKTGIMLYTDKTAHVWVGGDINGDRHITSSGDSIYYDKSISRTAGDFADPDKAEEWEGICEGDTRYPIRTKTTRARGGRNMQTLPRSVKGAAGELEHL